MKRIRWKQGAALMAGLLGLVASGLARASVDVIASFSSLVRAASDVAVVTPTEQHSEWVDGRIYTFSHLHVDEPFAGGVHVGDDVWVKTLGGVVGKIGQSVEGESVFVSGHPSLVFLRRSDASTFIVVGRAQGQFPVVVMADGSRSLQKSASVGGLVPQAVGAESAGSRFETPARDLLHGASLKSARDTIAEAWARFHPGK